MESIKVNKSVIVALPKGIMPPQAIELEEAVLGAALIDSNGLFDVVAILRSPEAFFKEAHKHIYAAILNLFENNEPVDLLTVSARLKSMNKLELAGGDFYLIQLSQKISSSAHSEYHARILMQKYIARNIIAFNSQITAAAYDESTDVFDLLARWSKEFDAVADLISVGRSTMQWKPALQELKQTVEMLSRNDENNFLVGVDTGFKRINRYTGGYRKQDLVIVAARPGMGKTAKVLKTAVANLKKDVPVGIISGEMSMAQLTARAFAIDTNFHLNQLMKYGFEKTEYFNTMQAHITRVENWPLHVDDSGNMDISDVIIKAKDWYRKHNIELLIIDYIQLMKDRSKKWNNRSDELLDISRRLKLLAKELNIPLIVLAQVNRECEKRGSNKRPMVIDIKDCGAIEQDADIIEFIYRPSEYGIDMNEDDYEPHLHSLINKGANAEVIFAKYRGGAKNTTLLKWVGDKTKFVDVDDAEDTVEYTSSNVIPVATPSQAFSNNDYNNQDVDDPNHFI
jgi:replicative DNA helicase